MVCMSEVARLLSIRLLSDPHTQTGKRGGIHSINWLMVILDVHSVTCVLWFAQPHRSSLSEPECFCCINSFNDADCKSTSSLQFPTNVLAAYLTPGSKLHHITATHSAAGRFPLALRVFALIIQGSM